MPSSDPITTAGPPLGGVRLVVAWLVLVVVAVGGAVQIYASVNHVARAGYSEKVYIPHFVSAAQDVMPKTARFANTPTAAERLHYGLFPRIEYHVDLSGDPDTVRGDLATYRISYVIVNQSDPTIFTNDTGPWWHTVLTRGRWRVIAVDP